jgi:hypothetical protein
MKLNPYRWVFAALGMVVGERQLSAAVSLEWRPAQQTVSVGDQVLIGLYAVTDAPQGQGMAALSAILQWDPLPMALSGVTNNGPYRWLQSGFPNDSGLDGLNNSWVDGDAKYECLAQFSQPAYATPAGLLIATVRFDALMAGPDWVVSIPAALGQWSRSQVFASDIPNHDITGSLGHAVVTVVPEPFVLQLLVALSPCLLRRPDRS